MAQESLTEEEIALLRKIGECMSDFQNMPTSSK
jgi:hypothetical protein